MLRNLLVAALMLCAAGSLAAAQKKDKSKDRLQPRGPIHLDRDGQKWADKALRRMSPEEKVGQLFMIWAKVQFMNEADPTWLQLRDSVRKYHIGSLGVTVPVDGPVLAKNQPYEAAELLNRLQKDGDLPLIFAADFERGVSMRLNGTTVFPHAMAFGATGKPENAEEFGRITALEARAIGVQWNFFPDADVNSNPANPIINTRSFGEDPKQVGDYVAAYIKGAHEGSMLTTAKHFPGHGDTATDSHLGIAQVTGDKARLETVELPPFKRAIDAGVDAVMVAHVTVPGLDSAPNRVASTSQMVVDGLLKKELGFNGIVVTDALDMAGLTRLYPTDVGRAAVEAFQAGNDLLIIPADLDRSYQAVLDAVHSGEISRERLDESVRKILELKASLGLHKGRLVDLNAISKDVGKPENLAVGQRIAEEAITLVRENGHVLPLPAVSVLSGTTAKALPYQSLTEARNRLVVIVFSDDLRGDSGRTLERQVLARVPDARIIYVDPRSADGMKEPVARAIGEAERVVAALYVVPTAGKAIRSDNGLINTVAVEDASASLLNMVLGRAASRTVVVAMGNPYVIEDFPSIQNYVCAFSNATVSEVAIVKALFGEIPITGHLPVTIPGIANRGEGLESRLSQLQEVLVMFKSSMLRREGSCQTHLNDSVARTIAITRLVAAAAIAALWLLPACSINVDKNGDKEGSKHVDIKSPLGDLHVSEQADIRDSGLSVYPGATPAPKDSNSDDEKSANVNLSMFGFQLKVIAAEFLSNDPPDKITAYYDKELQKFGKPIQCHGAYTKGGHVETQGKDDLSRAVSCDETSHGDGLELKVGTEGNQHIVAVKPDSKGSRFALVYVRIHTGKDNTI